MVKQGGSEDGGHSLTDWLVCKLRRNHSPNKAKDQDRCAND
jgi:hypothetical protein